MARIFDEVELGYVGEVLKSSRLGWYHEKDSFTQKFEEKFAAFVGAKFAIARNNAMNGLSQAVSVSGAGCGTEVICDPLVHFGAVATLFMNAVPRFADIKYDTYCMDPESVKQNITDKTKALIVTNLWGLCAELDEIRKICDEHGIFMIEDCAHAIGSYWKGKHAGTYGDLGVFSFQQFKQLTTGDGGMMVTNRDDLHYKLYHEWAFGGESPAFMTLNFRMNEVTAAIGLGQLQRVKDYIKEYKWNLGQMNAAIEECEWLKSRHVPAGAKQSGYWWVCIWEGDKHGLDYDRFKDLCKEYDVGVGFGFTQKPAYHYDIFKVSTAYHVSDCPIRCPFYKSDYRYKKGLCPVAEDLLPRVITMNVVEVPKEEILRRAEELRKIIDVMNSGGA